MRLSWGSLLVLAIGISGLVGCAHKPPPPPPKVEPSPAPKGDLLRFKANPGDMPKAQVSLLIEVEVMAKNGDTKGGKKQVLTFTLSEEEKVDAVAPDGTAQVSSRLVDAVGTAGAGATQEQVDQFALALDELKVQFRRSPRGDISSITVSGVRLPLDDRNARQILNAIYAGGRGPILPEEFVDVGGTWTNTTSIPTPFSTSAEAVYSYKYASKDNGIATITCEGSLDSSKAAGTATKKMTGKSSGEYKLDVAKGRLLSLSSDATQLIEDIVQGTAQPVGGGFRHHIKVSWTSNQ
jgi:hypothetical protein